MTGPAPRGGPDRNGRNDHHATTRSSDAVADGSRPMPLARSLLKLATSASGPAGEVYRECGECGATVMNPGEDCPYCDESRVVTYDL